MTSPTDRRSSPRTDTMGFNATRRYRDAKHRDIALLVVAVVVIGLMIAWGIGII
jgi:hypothetical protein